MEIRKYTDEERPRTYGKCYDCGLPYDKFPCDMVINDKMWKRITPTYREGGGLLCPNCICRRLMQLGGTCVHVVSIDVGSFETKLKGAPEVKPPPKPPPKPKPVYVREDRDPKKKKGNRK